MYVRGPNSAHMCAKVTSLKIDPNLSESDLDDNCRFSYISRVTTQSFVNTEILAIQRYSAGMFSMTECNSAGMFTMIEINSAGTVCFTMIERYVYHD